MEQREDGEQGGGQEQVVFWSEPSSFKRKNSATWRQGTSTKLPAAVDAGSSIFFVVVRVFTFVLLENGAEVQARRPSFPQIIIQLAAIYSKWIHQQSARRSQNASTSSSFLNFLINARERCFTASRTWIAIKPFDQVMGPIYLNEKI